MEEGFDEDEKLEKLTKELAETQSELTAAQSQLKALLKRAEKSERLYERTLGYNEDLREQVDKLSKQLHLFKTKIKSAVDKSIQTDAIGTTTKGAAVSTGSNGDISDDHRQSQRSLGSNETPVVSLAESLRETAEAAVENTGFVFDDNTGLYYDYNSGYFYDNENSLYFDPPSGTYFFYDDDSQEYKFHSQVDMTNYYEDQSKLITRHPPKRKQEKIQPDQNGMGSGRQSHKRKKRLKAAHADDGVRPKTSSQSMLNACTESPQLSEREPSQDLPNEQIKMKEEDSHSAKISQHLENNPCKISDSDEDNTTSESELESGELTDDSLDGSHGDGCLEVGDHGDSLSDEALVDEVNAANYPPCIRVMVTQSEVCSPGTLFIVTYPGGTIGREGSPVICLPELTVSKLHAEIRYSEEEKTYVVVDCGNQNGTFLNGTRISEPRSAGDPQVLKHGDVIVIGSSHLLCHIHQGLETCDLCEPGQVIANIQAEDTQPNDIIILSKEEKEKLRRKELKGIKKKYGLENINYIDGGRIPQNPAYSDKSEERRQTVGSDNPYQKSEAPASVHREISTSNKGHQLLQKMGWSEGGLGKNNHGIQEPVQVSFRLNKKAGLGSVLEQKTDLENVNASKRTEGWLKTQQRFRAVENRSPETSTNKTKSLQTQWVTGETLQFEDTGDAVNQTVGEQTQSDQSLNTKQ